MALFERKTAFEKIMELYHDLPDEEKAKVKESLTDVEKAEDEREIDKIEEEKAENPEVEEEKAEEVKEESEEIADKVDETETEEEKAEDEVEEAVEEETPVEEEKPEFDYAGMINGLESRLKALEEKFDDIMPKEATEDFGVNASGKREAENVELDTRANEVIKKLGGMA